MAYKPSNMLPGPHSGITQVRLLQKYNYAG
jgi:hypothetical protein